MPIFYKIRNDGKAVYVMKTLFNKSINELAENVEAFKEISIEKFLQKIPASSREKFERDILRVREIDSMNMFNIIRFSIYDPIYAFTRTVYNVDGKGFQQDDNDIKECDEKKDAIKYCIDKFGKEFIDKYGYIFENTEDENFYFANKKLISLSESNRLYFELEKLLSVQNLKNKIEEYSVKNKR